MCDQDRRGVAGRDVRDVEGELDRGRTTPRLYHRDREDPDAQQGQRGEVEEREDERDLGERDAQDVPPDVQVEVGRLGEQEDPEEQEGQRQWREQRVYALRRDCGDDKDDRRRREWGGDQPSDVFRPSRGRWAQHPTYQKT